MNVERKTCPACKGLAPIERDGVIEHCNTCHDTGFITHDEAWSARLQHIRSSARRRGVALRRTASL